MPSDKRGLIARINRAYLLQALLITIAAVLGVFFAKIVIEQILIKNAILEEEEYFWKHYSQDSNFPLPDTKNLTGFFDPKLLPTDIRNELVQQAGFHEFGKGSERTVLHVSEHAGKRLYLLYFRGQVDALVLYYGIFPLIVVLLILYLALWITYLVNRRTVSPVIRLAREINEIDFSEPDNTQITLPTPAFEADNEIQTLNNAIFRLGERLNSFVKRERVFTRDASHELRSPITVINIAADMLLSEQDLPAPALQSVHRIKRAVSDMEQLTEILLTLAREDDNALPRERVQINDIVKEEIELADILKQGKDVQIRLEQHNLIELKASDKVLSVLLGNLIRNAILYTRHGEILIRIQDHHVVIEDSGEGMSEEQVDNLFQPFKRGDGTSASGFGIGLTIVKRLSDRFNWPIDVQSQPGQGTRFRINFSNSITSQELF